MRTHNRQILISAVMALAISTHVVADETEIPVTHISLFSSGVGFFEHSGRVDGSTSTVLQFQTDQINDVLKSLVLQDHDGGSIGTVTYPSNDPIGRTLRGFQIDLSKSPNIASLLQQLRGSELSVAVQGEEITGTILGIEGRKRPAGQTTVDYMVVNLVTPSGIRSIAIDDANKLSLTDAKLQEELNKALSALAQARNNDRKNVTIDFKGDGERRVRVGYVVETPVWKTSYRLMMNDASVPESKSHLQGWAIVENQTDVDWNDISLSLISGRPLSFVMNLYDPMYLARPEAQLELFAGLTPQSYAEGREMIRGDAGVEIGEVTLGRKVQEGTLTSGSLTVTGGSLAEGETWRSSNRVHVAGDVSSEKFDTNPAVRAQASAGLLGELFEYNVKDITLARQSSAMIPIITDPIEVTRISIFNQNVLQRHPLSGARINNNTGKHLLQGPITVLDGTYAGDAQINNVPPGQTRLISYGVDLDLLIDAEKTGSESTIRSVRIVKGMLEITLKNVFTHTFKIENKSDKSKTLIIEEPKRRGWSLVESPKPVEETDSIYRFELKIDPKKSTELTSSQEIINSQQFELLKLDSDVLARYSKEGAFPEKVKVAILKAIGLRSQIVDLERQLLANRRKLDGFTSDQNRMRENMNAVDRNSELYGRLLKKLDAQETEIEELTNENESLTHQRDALRGELENYLSTLNVD